MHTSILQEAEKKLQERSAGVVQASTDTSDRALQVQPSLSAFGESFRLAETVRTNM